MEWVVLALSIIFVIFSWLIIQGTRAALAYRRQAAAGDVSVIRDLAEDAISVWRSQKRPKPVPAEVWRGIQSMQLGDVGPDYVRVSVRAEGDYKLVEGRWQESAGPLEAGMAITAEAADLLLYELPHCRLAKAQIDVYTAFREADGRSDLQCILSTIASREAAQRVDWEEWPAADIVEALGGRYRLDERGRALPVDPDEVSVSPRPVGEKDAKGDGREAATPP
ncbi:MAG: hypothetical protein ACE5KW_03035 [Dehalococcoidia bacterium]